MTTDDTDILRSFRDALTPAARHHLARLPGQGHVPHVLAACERKSPLEIARIVARGIGWNHPANAAGLIAFRLRREAGIDDDNNDQGEDA